VRKVLIIITFMCVFFASSFIEVNAYPYLVTPYWHSDDNKVGYFDSSTISYEYQNITCGMDSADFENTFDNAIYGWESNFSFTMNEVTSNEDISLGCFTRSQASGLGINPYAVGVTSMSYYSIPDYTYMNLDDELVYVHRMAYSQIFLIWDTSGMNSAQTSDFSESQWNEVSCHEMGHALGYFGHATSTNQLMYPYVQNAYEEPQYNDIAHLKLAYQ